MTANPFLWRRRPEASIGPPSAFALMSAVLVDEGPKKGSSLSRVSYPWIASYEEAVQGGNFESAVAVLEEFDTQQSLDEVCLINLANALYLAHQSARAERIYLQLYEQSGTAANEAADGLVRIWSECRHVPYCPGRTSAEARAKLRGRPGTHALGPLDSIEPAVSYSSKAVELARNSLLARQKQYGENHLQAINGWLSYGIALFANGAVSSAGRAFLKSLRLFRGSRCANPLLHAELRTWLARCQSAAGLYRHSMENMELSEEIIEVLCDTHPSLSTIRVELGCLREHENQLDAAENSYRKALELSTRNLENERLYRHTEATFLRLRRVLCKQWKLSELQQLFKAELQFAIASTDCDGARMRRLIDAFAFYRSQKVCPEIHEKVHIAEGLLSEVGYLKREPYVVPGNGPASLSHINSAASNEGNVRESYWELLIDFGSADVCVDIHPPVGTIPLESAMRLNQAVS